MYDTELVMFLLALQVAALVLPGLIATVIGMRRIPRYGRLASIDETGGQVVEVDFTPHESVERRVA
jgi:hypothetical protein